MLDKLLLNNQLITNKKKVQQARIHCIQQMVHKIRKLTKLCEKYPDKVNLKDKLRKSAETLNYLKKSKNVEVLRKALVNDKDQKKVITNGGSTPEELADALIISHKIVIDLVKNLKTLFSLDDKNPDWKDEVLETSKRKQKFLRTEEKKKKRAARKEQSALVRKRLEWLEENKGDKSEKEDSNSSPDSWEVKSVDGAGEEEVAIIKIEETAEEQDQIEPNLVKKQRKKNKSKDYEEKVEEKISKKKTVKDEKAPKLVEEKKTEAANKKRQKNKELEGLDEEKAPKRPKIEKFKPEEEVEQEEEEEEIKMAVDPFFFTNSGENYLSSAVVDRTQAEPVNDGLVRKERRANLQNPRRHGKNRNNNRNFDRVDRNNSKFNNKSANITNFQKDNKNPTKTFPKKETAAAINVHPSWAAKQKQKGIKEFAGKKITFGDDGEGKKDFAQKPKVDHAKINKPVAPKKPIATDLHPSWAAKQKLKPAIAAFQGKKIVFGDD